MMSDEFARAFQILTGHMPMRWQRRLYRRLTAGDVPSMLDLPTGLGKTSVMAIWLIARVHGAPLPRRLVYVVDRRAVVDQATEEAGKLRASAEAALGLDSLAISTLRGQFVDNREWLADPAALAIVIGTVDMVGSRLLFSGYGVSRKMRPYHAGLLGADTLIVLDEAHLVPPFAHLLRAVEIDPSFRPAAESGRRLVPGFVFLPLSATQRESEPEDQESKTPESPPSGGAAFGLEDEDRADPTVAERLGARKRLRLCPLAAKDPDRQLAEAAWELATKDGKFSRVVVFCNRREKADEGEVAGPSALGVADEIRKLAEPDRRAGRPRRALDKPVMLVGGRRVHERERVAMELRERGFIGHKESLERPAFLVATAAGEVGVDIDADHMVSDLVPCERMVQRLGRVNRRGKGDAEVLVFWSEPAVKNAAAPSETERRALTAFAAKAILEQLQPVGDARDAGPGALRLLTQCAKDDPELRKKIEKATTPEPLRPALDRAFVDAWSMTSLETHSGRPDVAPWLRGWVPDEQPQTTIIWRRYLPIRVDREGQVRLGEDGRPILPKKDIEEFFDAAPAHEAERLETETYRLPDWLRARAQAVLAGKPASSKEDTEAESDAETDAAEAAADDPADDFAAPAKAAAPLRDKDVAALLLAPDGDCIRGFTLADLAGERKARDRDEFKDKLAGNMLIIDARLGGLADGLLKKDSDGCPPAADDGGDWPVPFRIYLGREVGQEEEGWHTEIEFDLRRNDEGERIEWLVVEHFKDAAQKEDARSVANPQELGEHQDWARCAMRRIARELELPAVVIEALCIAAGLHDEGKKAWRWQRAFNAARDAKRCGLSGPLAKTGGPINQALLDGYRHEFGSLPHVEESPEFQALPEEWRDLVLHIVAAHHGFARPLIGTRGCDDKPESVLEQRAREAALRFARLQKRWGPWGLAWWEALLRAADAQASRKNDERTPEKNDAKPREIG